VATVAIEREHTQEALRASEQTLRQIIRWYSLHTDIDDRKKVEEELPRSEDYLAEAQKLSRTGSFGWNVSTGEIIWSKETYCILVHGPG